MAGGKWIPDLTADTPLPAAARRVLSLRLEAVRDALGLALREWEKDPEHIHQLRVGTRRAVAALDLFSLCLPEKVYRSARKDLRRLRRAAGDARDWDVFLQALAADYTRQQTRPRHGWNFLMGLALGQRLPAQERLREACPDYPFDFEKLLAETVAAVGKPHEDFQTLLDLARPVLFDLLKEFNQAAARDLDDYQELHQVRILGKRLRYAMEIFVDCFAPPFKEKLYPAIEEMQDILGRANDSHVACERLTDLGAKVQTLLPRHWKRLEPGLTTLLRSHEERLPKERKHFLDWWSAWQESGSEAEFEALLKPSPPANGVQS